MALDPGVDVGEIADHAGNRTGAHLQARLGEPAAVAGKFRIAAGELEAEGGGFGVDAVAPPDAKRVLVLDRPALEHREQAVEVGEQDIGGPDELHRKTGVEHVRRCHPLVHEARLRPDMAGEFGQEGDDVVLDLALDLFDPRYLEGTALPDRAGRIFRDDAELGLSIAGMGLDLEPDLETGFRRPDLGHGGTGIARYHDRTKRPDGEWSNLLNSFAAAPQAADPDFSRCGRTGRRTAMRKNQINYTAIIDSKFFNLIAIA